MLPDEILLLVFGFYCSDYSHPSSLPGRGAAIIQALTLCQVCEKWESLVLGCQELWTTIICDASPAGYPDVFHLALTLSRLAPLQVIVVGQDIETPTLVSTYSSHCQTLVLPFPCIILETVSTFVVLGSPDLESFGATSEDPKVKFTVPLTTTVLDILLKLDGPLSDTCAALGCFQNLHSLTIRPQRYMPVMFEISLEPPSIILPTLSNLILVDLDEFTTRFLSLLSA